MGTIAAGGTEPPKDPGANERRVALRRSVVDSHLITVDLAFQTGALLLDLSETGMGVQALASAPMGATTPLNFELPETGGRIEGVGRIAWTDSSGRLGIRFEEIAELSRMHLAQWLARERRPLVAPGPNMAAPSWPPPHTRDEIAALRRDLTTEKLTGDAALAFIVERMRSVTRATGAAIALEESGGIVCRASSGNAPEMGARVDPNVGLSGECLRTGEIVRCEDTETDPRADRLVCRRLELRSMVIVPVRVQGCPAGVLEAFSSRAHAFQSSDVLLLRRLSDLVAGIALRQPAPAPLSLMDSALLEPFLPEPMAEEITPPIMEEILSLDVEELAPPPPPPSPVTAKPQPAVNAPMMPPVHPPIAVPAPIAKPEIRTAPEKPPEHIFTAVEKIVVPLEASAPPAMDIPLPASMPLATREMVALPPAVDAPDFVSPRAIAAATAASVAIRPRVQPSGALNGMREPEFVSFLRESEMPRVLEEPKSPRYLKVACTGILIGVLLIGAWQIWQAIPPLSDVSTDGKQAEPVAPAATKPATPLPTARKAFAHNPAYSAPRTGKSWPQNRQPQVAGEAIALRPPKVAQSDSQAPPVISVAPARPAGESSAISSVLGAPVAAPMLEPAKVSHITGGKLIKRSDPVYPSGAMGMHGEVVLKATINREGKVTAVQTVKGPAVLAQAAAAAVRNWRYEPFVLNGTPIEVENTIVVNFKAPGLQE